MILTMVSVAVIIISRINKKIMIILNIMLIDDNVDNKDNNDSITVIDDH